MVDVVTVGRMEGDGEMAEGMEDTVVGKSGGCGGGRKGERYFGGLRAWSLHITC